MYNLGVPITVRVDDYVPTFNSYTRTLFSQMHNKSVWVGVLEKGFAKINGNYSSLVGGWSEQAVGKILGTPLMRFLITSTTTSASTFAFVDSAGESDIMAGNTKTGAAYGMVSNHAYSIINSYTVRLNNGATVNLIKLRNPYGSD